MLERQVAILIDGSFFLKRYYHTFGKGKVHTPQQVVKNLHWMCSRHLTDKKTKKKDELFRLYYYDCPPLSKKVHNPLTKRAIDLGKSDLAIFQYQFLDLLKRSRKLALRLGYLKDSKNWVINPRKTKDLLNGKIALADLQESDIRLEVNQKSVDIKIGVDITSLALKRQVQRIILVSGDADFVPAAKLARREGIDFVLDPMWNPINEDLYEHIDGLSSVCPKPAHLQKKN